MKTVKFDITPQEENALNELSNEQGLSWAAIYRQGLRLYQSDHLRRKAGETCTWSGDEQRMRDFAGPLIPKTPPKTTNQFSIVDLEGHMADAVRDSCLHVLGKVVRFDQSREITQHILSHLMSLAKPQVNVTGSFNSDSGMVDLDLEMSPTLKPFTEIDKPDD